MTLFDRQRPGRPVRFAGTLLGAVVVLGAGCSDDVVERGTVQGRVTYRGQALKEGTIVFNPRGQAGRPTSADIVEGNYSIAEDGPFVGSYLVEIHAYRKTGRKIPDLMGDVAIPNRPLIDEKVSFLPAKYNVETRLTAAIKAGDNEVNFDLN